MQLLISDLHLDASRPHTARAFFDFLRARAARTSELFILGDFFEMWLGDDDDDVFYASVKAALKEMVDRGIKTFFIHGNRDFLIGEEFCNETGVTLLPDEIAITLGSEPCLIMHGDTLCVDDQDYQRFRAQLRDPQWQQEFLKKNLSERRAVGRQMRAQSKTMSSRKSEDIMDVSQKEVERVMNQFNVNTLIHGHTHRPNTHQFIPRNRQGGNKQCRRIVLGDWDAFGWCIEADQSGIKLVHWPIAK
jgi:UDP-2,3-diacylglucosamine hydrolase